MHGSANLQQNPSCPWYPQLQIDERQKLAVDLNDLLKNDVTKGGYCKLLLLWLMELIWTIWNKTQKFIPSHISNW